MKDSWPAEILRWTCYDLFIFFLSDWGAQCLGSSAPILVLGIRLPIHTCSESQGTTQEGGQLFQTQGAVLHLSAVLGRFGHKPWTSHDINDISSLFTSSSWNLACNFENRRDRIFELGPESENLVHCLLPRSKHCIALLPTRSAPKFSWHGLDLLLELRCLAGNVGFVQRSGAPSYGIVGGSR